MMDADVSTGHESAMSIMIKDAEAEALLDELAARMRRSQPDLLLALLRQERERLEDQERRVAEALRIDEEFRRRLNARPIVDPRPIDEILAYDENGLPI